MRIREIFNEAPLADISYHPSDDPGAYTPRELALIKKYMKDDTYKTRLAKIPFNLYVYILDDYSIAEFGEQYPEGEISPAIWKDKTESKYSTTWGEKMDMSKPTFELAFAAIRERISIDPSSVHFVMGDNYADGAHIAPTPWIIAHRFIHAAVETHAHEIRFDGKSKIDISIIASGFNFKSAKSFKYGANDQILEFWIEVCTQYMLTGEVSFNEQAVRDHMVEDGGGYTNKMIDTVINQIKEQIRDNKRAVDDMSKKAKGKVFYI